MDFVNIALLFGKVLLYIVGGFIVLFLLMLLSAVLLMAIASGKCDHCKYCQWYRKDSYVCNETGGVYYPDNGAAGCCRDWDEKIALRNKEIEKADKIIRKKGSKIW